MKVKIVLLHNLMFCKPGPRRTLADFRRRLRFFIAVRSGPNLSGHQLAAH